MLKGVTQRQIIVLYVLLIFLAIVVGVRYAVIPLLEANDDSSATLMAKQDEYSVLLLETSQAATYEKENAELTEEIDKLKLYFQSELKTADTESSISELISGSGMKAVSVSVSDAADVTDESLSGDTSNGDASATDSSSYSNVLSVTSEVTAEGSYAQLVKLIGLIGDKEAMYMKDLAFTMKMTDGEADTITVNFSVVSFIYTEDEEQTTDKAA